MFELKNHTNNLQYSQRFYYSNYQFYNDYDDPKQYAHDISKIFYSCRRKTVPIITRFCSSDIQVQEDRVLRSSKQNQQQGLTMEQFLDSFINAFQQNNYSDFPDNALEDCKNIFKISNYPRDFILKLKYNPKQKQLKALKQPNNDLILRTVKGLLQNNIKQIISNYNSDLIHPDQLDYFRHLLAFSELASHMLYYQLFWKQTNKVFQNFLLFQKLLEQKLQDINIGQTSSLQVLYIPKLQTLSYFINPALLVVKNYVRKSQQYSRSQSNSQQAFHRQIPKIAFINLDSRQYPLNFQFFKTNISSNMIYITIYNQIESLNENNDESTMFYSRYLSQLVYQCNNAYSKTPLSSPILFAFPLSSHYVKSKVSQKKPGQKRPHMEGTSSDITFLFENCIYQQLRIFVPNVIFISYNGSLHIQQSYFNQILRTLTLIADHKVILFTNFCTLFYDHNYLSQKSAKMIETSKNSENNNSQLMTVMGQNSQMQQSQDSMIQKTYDYSNIHSEQQYLLAFAKFLEDYLHFEISDIDINEFFNNLGMFNKITSGAYSFQRKRDIKPSQKFQIGQKYLYLETLSQLREFQYLRKYCSTGKNATTFSIPMKMQRDNLLKINKQQTNFYQYFIDNGINLLLQKQNELPNKLKYKLQKLKFHFETHQICLKNYLQERKKSILIQSITKQKIKKIFTLNSNKNAQKQAEINDIRSYDLFLKNNQGQKQQIFLQNFSQVMIDSFCSIIFCINYLHYQYKLCVLYGFPQNGKTQVQMFKLKQQQFHSSQLYFQYSSYFSPQNNLLYLYWPYEWNAIQQACSLLLSIKYEPKLINHIKIIRFNSMTKQKLTPACITQLTFQNKQNIEIFPRYGSTMWARNQNELFILGGFFDNKKDFNNICSGVSIVTIKSNKKFTIQDIPKAKLGIRLRPKANYVISRLNQDHIVIQGGYGRQFTNFYNVYSYVRYIFNLHTYKLIAQKTKRQISSLKSPITNKRLGQYEAVRFEDGRPKHKTVVGGMKKHRFILRDEQANKLISFISDEYYISTHKQDNKTAAIFQLNRTIKNIYCHTYCSPQLYLQKKQGKNIIRIQILAAIFNHKQQFTRNHILPYEDSLISTCISQCGQHIYMLAQSPIYTNQSYIIYEGNLGQIEQILQKKQIKLRKYYQFSPNTKNIQFKTIHSVGSKIIVAGGVPSQYGYRQDYILEYFRGVLRAKLIKIAHQQTQILQMKNSYIISSPQNKQQLYLYSIEADPQTQTIYQLKIQSLKTNPCTGQQHIHISNLITCTIINNCVYEIKPEFSNPTVVSIQRYFMYNLDSLYEKLRVFVTYLQTVVQDASCQYSKQLGSLLPYLMQFIELTQEQFIINMDKLYTCIGQMLKIVCHTDHKSNSQSQIQHSITDILSILLTIRIQNICLKFISDPQLKQLYRFYVQDKNYPLAKYIALGQLGSLNLLFFRLKFNKKVAIPVKMINNSFLYGRNLSPDNTINQILFSDENFIRKYITQDQQSIEIGELQAQVHQYTVQCHISGNYNNQMI